jgi:S-adenosylmethionine synthetase
MKVTLDRIEGDIAVLLIRNDESIKLNVPMAFLPESCKEEDILDITITRDDKATKEAESRVSGLIQKLKNKSKGSSGVIEDPVN